MLRALGVGNEVLMAASHTRRSHVHAFMPLFSVQAAGLGCLLWEAEHQVGQQYPLTERSGLVLPAEQG